MSLQQNSYLSQSETMTKILCARAQEKYKMAAIGSRAHVAAFDWNNWDQKRKLLVILMMITDDKAVLVLLLGFHCPLVSCPIELDYP